MPSRRPPRVRDRSAEPASSPAGQGQDHPHEELVARCLAHAEGAWEEFLRRYGRLIYSTIFKVGLPADEREEAFQETIAAIYRQLGGLRESNRLISWIIGIAWRQSVNRIRRRGRETRMEEVDDRVLQESLNPPEQDAPPDELRVQMERAQQTREALDALPDRCRRLLEILFFEDPPPDYAEIARRQGLPIGSLGPTRARCLEKMRSFFEEQGWA